MALDVGQTGKTFRWDDPLDLASRLTEEERMVGEAARAYAREKLLPRVVSAFAQERFDREIMTEMGALGFLGATLPDEYGGAGVSHVAYGLIAREIEAIDCGYRSAMSVQSSLVMYPIHAFGSEEQRRRWLPGMARGEAVGCFGLTEADGGSDPGVDAHRGQARRRRLCPQRRQDVDHQRADLPMSPWSGPSSTAIIRGFLVERGAAGFDDAEDREQAFPARLGHRRDRALGRVRAARTRCCRTCRGCAGRSPASTRRATASPGARSGRRSSASTPRATTSPRARCSAGRWPPAS